jgi:hypothetical protein
MPNPNQVQAINLLRRLRADSTRQEAEKAAKALIEQIRAHGASLTVQGVVRTALASHPDQDAFSAVQTMAQEIALAGASNSEVQRLFNAAADAEEIRLGPFDAACAKRGDEIQNLLEAAHLDYRSKLLGQDRLERLWKSYADKGLTRDEILKLQIPEPIPGRDFVAERNAWGFELEQTTQALTTERDAITRFKYSRNENALPASVLALVGGEKVQS